jgi:hypothetical protein
VIYQGTTMPWSHFPGNEEFQTVRDNCIEVLLVFFAMSAVRETNTSDSAESRYVHNLTFKLLSPYFHTVHFDPSHCHPAQSLPQPGSESSRWPLIVISGTVACQSSRFGHITERLRCFRRIRKNRHSRLSGDPACLKRKVSEECLSVQRALLAQLRRCLISEWNG